MTILDKIKDRRSYKETPPKEEVETDYVEEDGSLDNQNNNTETSTTILDSKEIIENISNEIKHMFTYALHKGKEIPEEVNMYLVSHQTKDLFHIHAQLCKIIEPANPETINFLYQCSKDNKKRILFSYIPLVRNFIIIAIMAIICLIGSGLSAEVNAETLSKGILNNSGMSLFKNLLFLCSGSLIGVVFFLLSKLTKEVKEATLSKDDNTYYWAMLIMGMLSGLIMSEVVVLNQASLEGQSVEMNRLLFALLGGFSSEVVYGILQSIMDKLNAILGGDR